MADDHKSTGPASTPNVDVHPVPGANDNLGHLPTYRPPAPTFDEYVAKQQPTVPQQHNPIQQSQAPVPQYGHTGPQPLQPASHSYPPQQLQPQPHPQAPSVGGAPVPAEQQYHSSNVAGTGNHQVQAQAQVIAPSHSAPAPKANNGVTRKTPAEKEGVSTAAVLGTAIVAGAVVAPVAFGVTAEVTKHEEEQEISQP